MPHAGKAVSDRVELGDENWMDFGRFIKGLEVGKQNGIWGTLQQAE